MSSQPAGGGKPVLRRQQSQPINLTKSDELQQKTTTGQRLAVWQLDGGDSSTSSAGASRGSGLVPLDTSSSSSALPVSAAPVRPASVRQLTSVASALPAHSVLTFGQQQQQQAVTSPAAAKMDVGVGASTAVMGHSAVLAVGRPLTAGASSGSSTAAAAAGSIALVPTSFVNRAPTAGGGGGVHPGYHVTRGVPGPRVIGAQAVRVGSLPFASLAASAGQTVSYQVSQRAVTPPGILPARMLVPVSSPGGHPLVLRAAPAALHASAASAGVVKTISKTGGRLASVSMTTAPGRAIVAGGRATISHVGVVRTGTPLARLSSCSSPSTAVVASLPTLVPQTAAGRQLHISHIAAVGVGDRYPPRPASAVVVSAGSSTAASAAALLSSATTFSTSSSTAPAAALTSAATLRSSLPVSYATAVPQPHPNSATHRPTHHMIRTSTVHAIATSAAAATVATTGAPTDRIEAPLSLTVPMTTLGMSRQLQPPAQQLIHQSPGAKVITQPAHGPPLPVPLSPISAPPAAVAPPPPSHQLPHRGSIAPTATVIAVSTAALAVDAASQQPPVSAFASVVVPMAVPVAKVVPQQQTLMVNASLRDLPISVAAGRSLNPAYGGGSSAMLLSRNTVPMATYASSVASPASYASAMSAGGHVEMTSSRSYSPAVGPAAAPSGRLAVVLEARQQQMLTPTTAAGCGPALVRVATSPRPSILRKRDSTAVAGDPSSGCASRDLSRQLAAAVSDTSAVTAAVTPTTPPPTSRGGTNDSALYESGHSSSTVSADSSPGGPDEPCSAPPAPTAALTSAPAAVVVGLSPRKKPRKQNFGGAASPSILLPTFSPSSTSTALTASGHHHHYQFQPSLASSHQRTTTSSPTTTTTASASAQLPPQLRDSTPHPSPPPPSEPRPVFRRPVMSLLGPRATTRGAHNALGGGTGLAARHFERYQDVRVKDERRPTVVDMSSQRRVEQKVDGWRIHHLGGQADDLLESERSVHRRLADLLRASEKLTFSRRDDKEVTKLSELIKGAVQRSKITSDQLSEAKVQLTSIFEHKQAVRRVVERYGRKRPQRRRERC